MKKTNVIRILESQEIDFDVLEYEHNDEEIDAVSVAGKIDAKPEKVFKTLVTVGSDNENYVFIIPGSCELNLKKAATAADVKKIEMIKMTELLPLTGYVRGGCSPIGMKKLLPTFIDETAQLFDKIYVSAGVRGLQIQIAPDDLTGVIKSQYHDLF